MLKKVFRKFLLILMSINAVLWIRIRDPVPFLTPGSGIPIKGTEEQATGQAGIRPANRGHVGALCEYQHQCFRSG